MKRRDIARPFVALGRLLAVAAMIGTAAPAMALQTFGGESYQSAGDAPADDVRQELRAVEELRQTVFKELDLDERQTENIGKLFDRHAEEIGAVLEAADEERKENAERMNALRESLEEAKRERDREQIREIRGKMRQLDSSRMRLQRAYREFDRRVADELDSEDKSAYRRMAVQSRRSQRSPRRTWGVFGRTQRILRELDTSKEQNTKIGKLAGTIGVAMTEARGDSDAVERAMTGYREQVLAVLTDEQKARFLELEKEAEGNNGRRRRGRNVDN